MIYRILNQYPLHYSLAFKINLPLLRIRNGWNSKYNNQIYSTKNWQIPLTHHFYSAKTWIIYMMSLICLVNIIPRIKLRISHSFYRFRNKFNIVNLIKINIWTYFEIYFYLIIYSVYFLGLYILRVLLCK